MEYVNFPSSASCVYMSGSNSLNAITGNTRTTYYIIDSPYLVQGSTSDYARLPDGVHCLESSELLYKPEVSQVYFPLAAVLIFLVIFLFFVKLLFRGWSR